MKPQREREAQRWLREAENDLGAARHLCAGGFWSTACFHAQQAGEKAVKAYLYGQGATEARGHSVADLLEDAGTHEAALQELYAVGAGLDRYYIPTRYPNGLPGGQPMLAYRAQDAERAIGDAERILEAVGERLSAGRVGD